MTCSGTQRATTSSWVRGAERFPRLLLLHLACGVGASLPRLASSHSPRLDLYRACRLPTSLCSTAGVLLPPARHRPVCRRTALLPIPLPLQWPASCPPRPRSSPTSAWPSSTWVSAPQLTMDSRAVGWVERGSVARAPWRACRCAGAGGPRTDALAPVLSPPVPCRLRPLLHRALEPLWPLPGARERRAAGLSSAAGCRTLLRCLELAALPCPAAASATISLHAYAAPTSPQPAVSCAAPPTPQAGAPLHHAPATGAGGHRQPAGRPGLLRQESRRQVQALRPDAVSARARSCARRAALLARHLPGGVARGGTLSRALGSPLAAPPARLLAAPHPLLHLPHLPTPAPPAHPGSAENAVTAEWSPCGRYLMAATVAPRLRVDNGLQARPSCCTAGARCASRRCMPCCGCRVARGPRCTARLPTPHLAAPHQPHHPAGVQV